MNRRNWLKAIAASAATASVAGRSEAQPPPLPPPDKMPTAEEIAKAVWDTSIDPENVLWGPGDRPLNSEELRILRSFDQS